MKDADRSKEDLLKEVAGLRGRVAELEATARKASEAEQTLKHTAAMFDAFMSYSPTIAFLQDKDGRFVYINKEYEKNFKITLEDIKGRTTDDIFPPAISGILQRHSRQVRETGKALEIIENVPTADGVLHQWLMAKFLFKDESGQELLGGVAADITDRIEAEDALNLLATVTAVASEAETLNEMASRCLETICKLKGWDFGQVWCSDSGGTRLTCSKESYYCSGEDELRDFRAVSLHSSHSKGTGLLGKVWQTGGLVWIPEIKPDDFPRAFDALSSGLHSALAFPIVVGQKVLAVFEFFSREPRRPTPQLLDALQRLGAHLGIAFERKLTDVALQQSTVRFDSFMNHGPALAFMLDEELRLIYINKRFEEQFAVKASDVIGKDARGIFPEEHAQVLLEHDRDALVSGEEIEHVEVLPAPDGSRHHWLTFRFPIGDAAGRKFVGIVAIDVSERMEAEESLQRAHDELEAKVEERTRELEEASIFFSLSLDLLSISGFDGYFKRLNPYWRRTLGYTVEELLAKPMIEFVHPDDREETVAVYRGLASGIDVINFENRFICKDGTTRVFLWSATVLEGTQVIYAVAHDITERKKTEQTIKKLNESLEQRVTELAAVNQELHSLTQKLEVAYGQAIEASNLKSQFVANISHEIRSPLSGVIGMSELMLQTDLSSDQRQLASTIHESANSLLTIINDILDFSKMEAGKLELEVIEFTPLALVEGTAELVKLQARDKGLSLMTYVDPKIPSWLLGDPVRLKQVLLNLVDNAIKFTESGEVVVRAVLTDEDEGDVTVSFSVTDTGIGLSADGRAKLFRPFVQADGSTTRKYGGTGLGLSISKHLIDLMEGEIGVESGEGKGSAFWFTVTLRRAKRESEITGSQMASDGKQLAQARVLVVDDSRIDPDIIANYLAAEGVLCETAFTPQAALDSLRREKEHERPFDLAIINLFADPDAPFQFASSIKTDPLIADTRLALVTPFEEASRSERLAKVGFNAIITKPVRQSSLLYGAATGIGRPAGEAMSVEQVVALALAEDRRAGGEAPAPPVPGTSDKLVLVAEDNPVLQNLAVRQLERLGVKAAAVFNGKEAVEAVRNNQYGLVLMDCQMPEMDGFEATIIIRQNEAADARHVPIIAMTAGAMPGDRENCLTVGMNDYLSKPVSLEALRHVIEHWLPDDSQPPPVGVPEQAPVAASADEEFLQEAAGIDLQNLRDTYGDNALDEILSLFCSEAESLLTQLQNAITAEDRRSLATIAHQLKGLSAVLSASKMLSLSIEFERASASMERDRAQDLFGQLRTAYDAVKLVIERFLRSLT